MDKWRFYIVKCNDGSLYTGITKDLEERLKRHNQGRASKYTKVKLPVSLVYSEILDNESLAKRREIQVKKLSHTNKLKLIEKSLEHILSLG